jgi:hypothetical protein
MLASISQAKSVFYKMEFENNNIHVMLVAIPPHRMSEALS